MVQNGLRTFALHASEEAAATSLLPEVAVAPRDATGRLDLSGLDPETVAQRYLQNALASPALPGFTAAEVNGHAGEFRSLGVRNIPFTHTRTVKFRQFYHKIPLYGSLVTVELDQANELVSINSALGDPANVDPVAYISPLQALNITREKAGYGSAYLDANPRLYYYFDQQAQRWRLVYIIEDVLKKTPQNDEVPQEARLPEVVDYVIDAHSGDVVRELPRTKTMGDESITETVTDGLGDERLISTLKPTLGPKRLQDQDRNVHTHDFKFKDAFFQRFQLPGDYTENPPEPWDAASVSAHANAEDVITFLKEVLLRDGLDDQGGPAVSTVNCVFQNFTGTKIWKNAARFRGQMIYGQRLVNGELVSYAVAKDVVAHELLHGLTEHTADLVYEFESGALNESYSDIFGIIVSNFGQQNISAWDFKMGEDLTDSGLPLRDLSAPTNHGQPDHMDDFVHLPEDSDHGGVHTNSGIHNKAAHNILMAKDETGSHLFDAVFVSRLFYLALTEHLSATSGFLDSRRGVEVSAKSLLLNDPAKDKKLEAIAKAFDNVGIKE